MATRRTIIIIAMVLFGCAAYEVPCYAKDYYAGCIYELTGKSGTKYAMNVVTKTNDKATCEATANSNPKIQGKWILKGAECYVGAEYDENFSAVFNNQPTGSVYLSYINRDGFETRVNYVGLTGSDSPVPGFPIDIPVDKVMPLIDSLKQQLETVGVKDIKVIYPKKK